MKDTKTNNYRKNNFASLTTYLSTNFAIKTNIYKDNCRRLMCSGLVMTIRVFINNLSKFSTFNLSKLSAQYSIKL